MMNNKNRIGGFLLLFVGTGTGIGAATSLYNILIAGTLGFITLSIVGLAIWLLRKKQLAVASTPAVAPEQPTHHMSIIEKQNALLSEWNDTAEHRDKLKMLSISSAAQADDK